MLECVVVKTVAGFLNRADGGTVVIAVGDDGSLVGLDHDYATLRKPGKPGADLFQLHLTQLIATAVGLAAAAHVTTAVHTVDGRDLCRARVAYQQHCPIGELLAPGEDRHLERLNNGTRAIDDNAEVQRYVAQRWGAR